MCVYINAHYILLINQLYYYIIHSGSPCISESCDPRTLIHTPLDSPTEKVFVHNISGRYLVKLLH